MGQGRDRKLVTENSTPVGSGRVFIQNSSNYRTSVLSNSDHFPATLFSETLLSAPLPTHAERMGLEYVIFSLHPDTDSVRSQHKYRVSRHSRRTGARTSLAGAIDSFLSLVQRREELAVNGQASPYHNLLETGWVNYYLNGLERVQDLNVTF